MISGTPMRAIAGQNGVSKTAIARHRDHISAVIKRNAEAQGLARTNTILEDVESARIRAESLYFAAQFILDEALEKCDGRMALQAIRSAIDVMREARACMELRGQLTGELAQTSNHTGLVTIVVPSLDPASIGASEHEVINIGRT